MSDESLALILDALDETNGWDNTIVIFTADHGDQCGSHGLRSKGPWNYEETMRIPLYVVAPGSHPGWHHRRDDEPDRPGRDHL